MKFPKPAPAQEATTFREFLKVKHIGGKVGGRAKLTVAGKPTITKSTFGEQLVIPVIYKGTTYDFGVKLTSPSYGLLWSHLGDPDKWKKNATFNVVALAGRTTGSAYLVVE